MVDLNWAVLTAAFLMVLYMAQAGIVLTSVLHLANVRGGTWREEVAPYAHATAYLFPLAFLLLLALLSSPELTFPYTGKSLHPSAWLHFPFLAAREIGMLLLVAGLSVAYVRASDRHRREQTPASRNRLTAYASAVIVLYVLYATIVSWDFEMTLTEHWHSAIYAPYFFVSSLQMFLAFLSIAMYALRRLSGGTRGISDTGFNCLAQMMLGFTLLWTYTFFSQFLTIWYAALPDETRRLFPLMFEHGDIRRGPSVIAPLFWSFVAMKSFSPFFMLIFSVTRHTPGVAALAAMLIFVGTFLERFTWIADTYPGWQMPLSTLFGVALLGAVTVVVFFVLRWAFLRVAVPVTAKEH